MEVIELDVEPEPAVTADTLEPEAVVEPDDAEPEPSV